MAEIFSTSAAAAPVTPIKSNPVVQAMEVSPEDTPAPKYTKSSGLPPLFEAQASSKPKFDLQVMPDTDHPVLPIGNIQLDVRNHVSCHNIYNMNIETLLREYSEMKIELEKSQHNVIQLEQELNVEKAEKQAYKDEAMDLRQSVRELEDDLSHARAELVIAEEKLASAIKQLMDVAQRLEDTKARLREALREKAELARKLAATEVELAYSNRRIEELEIALAVANRGENDANDRNVRLTQMLYEIERQKASIERVKDQAEARVRSLRDQLNKGAGQKTIEELLAKIVSLERQKTEVQREHDTALEKVKDAEKMNTALMTDLDSCQKHGNKSWDLLNTFELYTSHHSHWYCKCPGLYQDLRDQKKRMGKPPGLVEIMAAPKSFEEEFPDDKVIDGPVEAEKGATAPTEKAEMESNPTVNGTTESTPP